MTTLISTACKFVWIPYRVSKSPLTPILDTTGPSDATSAIFIIYDIFGFSSQALQGADILARADESHQYQVFMPDFFLGKPLPLSVFPPDTDEKKKQMGDFFAGPANPPDNAEKVPELVKKLGQKYTGIQKWGSLGMCWGGKVGEFCVAKWGRTITDRLRHVDCVLDLASRHRFFRSRGGSSCHGRP